MTLTAAKPALVSLSLAPLAKPLVAVPLATVTPVVKSTLPEAPAEALALGAAEDSAAWDASADLVPGAWSPPACLLWAGWDVEDAPDEPPPELLRNSVTAPQASAGTTMMTASSGAQLRHRGTWARCTPTGTGPSSSPTSNSSSG